jgi:phosphate transport system substrate-binding protein
MVKPMRFSFMRQTLAVAALAAAPLIANAADLTGAGATFPAPVYAKWAEAYQKATGNRVNYQSIGSSGGIRQIKAKTVDFGASDAPLKPEELAKDGLMQFPTVIGGVVPVVNIAGVKPGQLRLNGQVLGDIYLGKITKWNDKAIADLNPGTQLPSQDIGVVRRADGSGTTFIFTNYLAKVNAEWKQKIGEGQSVQWPVGLGGKGNEGVAAFVQRLPGSIGYVEYAYAKQNKLSHAMMQNAAGAFVGPDDSTFKAAAAGADWGKSAFYEILTNQQGKDSWPITGATFILVPRTPDKPDHVAEVLKFFNWAYENGDKLALDLDYVPMPDAVVKLVRTAWSSGIKDGAGKSVWASK